MGVPLALDLLYQIVTVNDTPLKLVLGSAPMPVRSLAAWSVQFVDDQGEYTDVLVSEEAIAPEQDMGAFLAKHQASLEKLVNAKRRAGHPSPIILGKADLFD